MYKRRLTNIHGVAGVSVLLVLMISLSAFAQRERPDRPDHGAAGTKTFERPEAADTVRLDTADRVNNFFEKQTRKFQNTPKEPSNTVFRANLALINTLPVDVENISAAKAGYRSYLERMGQSSNRAKPLSFGKYLEIYFIAKNPNVSNKVSLDELVDQASKGKKLSEVLRSRGITANIDSLVTGAQNVSKQYKL